MDQKKFEKRLKTIAKKHSDKCTCCRTVFKESCHTFSGLDVFDKVQVVGKCCLHKLSEVRAGGVFVAPKDYTSGSQEVIAQLSKSHPLSNRFSNPSGKTEYIKQ